MAPTSFQGFPKEAFTFLKEIKTHNNKTWFEKHKEAYVENVVEPGQALVEALGPRLQKVAKTVQYDSSASGHGSVKRIYRDVRFSKDKSPYKTNFGASFSRATARLRGGYYLHIQPGHSFVGGGFWNPNSADLLRIRKEFEMDSSHIRKIIQDKNFKKYFGDLMGDEVSTAPKGFDKNDPNIDLIRKKQFLVKHDLDDKIIGSSEMFNQVTGSYAAMRPFFDYMSQVLTTDLNGESVI